jgi:predicted N-acetyltransferase YhbS
MSTPSASGSAGGALRSAATARGRASVTARAPDGTRRERAAAVVIGAKASGSGEKGERLPAGPRKTAAHALAPAGPGPPPVAEEVEPAWAVLEHAFGTTPHPDDREVETGVVEPARFYGARLPGVDGDALVGTAGSWAFSMTVPGATLPVAGVTWVGVAPTRRRRGVLGALMRRQLDDLHEEGTAVAALWASEAAIYGRYGYGPASWRLHVTVPHASAFRAPVPIGELRRVEPGCEVVRETYARVAASTVGWPQRDDAWWAFAVHDPEHRRSGASPLECVAVDGGYATYAVVFRWRDGLTTSEVRVRELVAADRTAHAGSGASCSTST